MHTIIEFIQVSAKFHGLHAKADIQRLLGKKEQARKTAEKANLALRNYTLFGKKPML